MKSILKDIFSKQGKWVRIYVGKETIQDPYEKNVVVSNINPIPVRAIIEDLTATQANYKMPGIIISKAKDILIEVKHKSLFELSSKIEINGDFYEGWRESGKMQFREELGLDKFHKGYLRLYVYSKAV
jgi:hypothetical protein